MKHEMCLKFLLTRWRAMCGPVLLKLRYETNKISLEWLINNVWCGCGIVHKFPWCRSDQGYGHGATWWHFALVSSKMRLHSRQMICAYVPTCQCLCLHAGVSKCVYSRQQSHTSSPLVFPCPHPSTPNAHPAPSDAFPACLRSRSTAWWCWPHP